MSESDVSLGGHTVVTGNLLLPRVGLWSAWIDNLDAPNPLPEGAFVTLRWLGTDLRGYVVRSGISEGRVSAVVQGGAGGLAREVPAAGYVGPVAVQQILGELLGAVGETLAPASTGLQVTLPAWTRQAGTAGTELEVLAAATGARWRCQPDGAILWGVETWPTAAPQGELLPGSVPAIGLYLYAPTALDLLPGQAWQGGHVGVVSYSTGPRSQRARVWLLQDDAQEDPLRGALQAVIRQELRALDYLACYPCAVVHQRADGTVDVIPDSDRVPPLSSVPLRVPAPGARVTLPAAGARALLGFLGGSAAAPYVVAWERGAGGAAVARVGDRADVGTLVLTVVAPGVLGGTYTDPFGVVTPISSGASIPLKAKITSGSPHLALLEGSSA